MKDYKNLPDHSRVWIYQANRVLSNEEVDEIKEVTTSFVTEWAAHGNALEASVEVFYNRFVVIFVDQAQVLASGCSIDSLVRFVQQLENKFDVSLLDRMQVAYRNDVDQIIIDHLNDFRNKIAVGLVNEETIVFNNLADTKEKFSQNWEVELKNSWHKQLI